MKIRYEKLRRTALAMLCMMLLGYAGQAHAQAIGQYCHQSGTTLTFSDEDEDEDAIGVVFHVDRNLNIGYIAKTQPLDGDYQWYGEDANLPTIPSAYADYFRYPGNQTISSQALTGDFLGYYRTQVMKANDCPAANALTTAGLGDNWYLPSAGQLHMFCSVLGLMPAAVASNFDPTPSDSHFPTIIYWSSTELDGSASGVKLCFSNSHYGMGDYNFLINTPKTTTGKVLPVCSFRFDGNGIPTLDMASGSYNITTTVNDMQRGEVTVSPAGPYSYNQVVTVTAHPAGSNHFFYWNDYAPYDGLTTGAPYGEAQAAPAGTDVTRKVIVSQDMVIAASFSGQKNAAIRYFDYDLQASNSHVFNTTSATITIDPDGGRCLAHTAAFDYTFTGVFNLPDPTRVGPRFMGWKHTELGGNDTYKAMWDPDMAIYYYDFETHDQNGKIPMQAGVTYKITIDPNGGVWEHEGMAYVEPYTMQIHDGAFVINNASRNKYGFRGWLCEHNRDNEYTFTAQWQGRINPGDIYCENASGTPLFVNYKEWTHTGSQASFTPKGVVFYAYFGMPEDEEADPVDGWHGWIVELDEAKQGWISWNVSAMGEHQADMPEEAKTNLNIRFLPRALEYDDGHVNYYHIPWTFSPTKARRDFKGKERTQYWVNHFGYEEPGEDGLRYPALHCYEKDPVHHQWYLPAMGQMTVLLGNLGVVNAALKKINEIDPNSAVIIKDVSARESTAPVHAWYNTPSLAMYWTSTPSHYATNQVLSLNGGIGNLYLYGYEMYSHAASFASWAQLQFRFRAVRSF